MPLAKQFLWSVSLRSETTRTVWVSELRHIVILSRLTSEDPELPSQHMSTIKAAQSPGGLCWGSSGRDVAKRDGFGMWGASDGRRGQADRTAGVLQQEGEVRRDITREK